MAMISLSAQQSTIDFILLDQFLQTLKSHLYLYIMEPKSEMAKKGESDRETHLRDIYGIVPNRAQLLDHQLDVTTNLIFPQFSPDPS